MSFLVIAVAAFAAALLTFYSGFGLGTLLMPVIALFFPIEIAIAVTAVVHLVNNLLKAVLVGRQASFPVFLRFGIPAILAALIGALLLVSLVNVPPVTQYTLADEVVSISPVKLVIGILILGFVVIELLPSLAGVRISSKWLPLGGVISGFFGGLSGHQGAFRSMFLLGTGLDKHVFIATGVVIAVAVDLTRLIIYGSTSLGAANDIDWLLVGVAGASALAGTILAKRLLEKITIQSVRNLVAALLIVVGIGLISGLL